MNLNHSSHLRNILCITTFSIIGVVFALSDVNKDCIKEHNDTVSNDFLLGTWYKIYQFKLFGVVPTASCPNITFSKPTLEEIQGYRDKYKDLDLPHSIDDNSIEATMGFRTKGLFFGESEAKTFVLEPKSQMQINREGYELYVFKRINDEYAFYWTCALSNFKWLLARDKYTSVEKMQEITRNRTEIRNMNAERYCTLCSQN